MGVPVSAVMILRTCPLALEHLKLLVHPYGMIAIVGVRRTIELLRVFRLLVYTPGSFLSLLPHVPPWLTSFLIPGVVEIGAKPSCKPSVAQLTQRR